MKKFNFETEMMNLVNMIAGMSKINRKSELIESLALAKYKDMPKLNKPDDYHEKIEILEGYYAKDPLLDSQFPLQPNRFNV